MADDKKTPTPPPPTFTDFLAEVEDGSLARDIQQDLAMLTHNMRQQALATGGKPKARIALTLTFSLESDVFEVRGEYKVTEPKKPRGRTLMFPQKDGSLSSRNARQTDMFAPAKDVTGSDEPMRVVR